MQGREPSSPLPLGLGREAAGVELPTGELGGSSGPELHNVTALSPIGPAGRSSCALPRAVQRRAGCASPQPAVVVKAPETTEFPGPAAHPLDLIGPSVLTK